MQGPAHTIAMAEGSARRIVLVRSLETGDPQGRLVPLAEREQADRDAAEVAKRVANGTGVAAIALFLQTRAALVLRNVAPRDPGLASLQEPGAGHRGMSRALPLGALLLGIFTDQVANPHQVNLLSKPLLLLLLWNAVVYLLLLAHLATGTGDAARPPRFAALRQWLAGLGDWRRRQGHLRSEVALSFLAHWHAVSAGITAQRLARVMHLSAAAWALGVALSLFFGGVWASYGVQWESTFLSAADVHRFLSILFKPVTVLFPWASFSLEEVRSLRATGPMPGPRDASDNFSGRRWVFLYAMLLTLGIVLPRLLLAAMAWWRERSLARNVLLDLGDVYYQRLVAVLSPARVQLCLYAQRGEDRAALLRVLLHRTNGALPGIGLGRGQTHALMTGAAGEVLRLLDLQNVIDPSPLLLRAPLQATGWAGRLRDTVFGRPTEPLATADGGLRNAREDTDVVLHVVSDTADPAAAALVLRWLGKPVLVLVNTRSTAMTNAEWAGLYGAAPAGSGAVAGVLGFDQFARCWAQEPALLDAVGRCLPAWKAAGFARLVMAWDQRNRTHLQQSMAIIGAHLLAAARQSEDVGTAPRSLVSLVSPVERDAHERRSREAMATVVDRLQRSASEATASLLVLHGAPPTAAAGLNHRLEETFVLRDTISPAQAGMAGAATGAAMGVSIDLLTAGLTLGLAAAAGAVVGGGTAWVAAVWKNKATPAGTSVVQPGDAMLQALVEAALLRYLAVIHLGRTGSSGAGAILPEWRGEVVAAVEGRSDDLKGQWAAARSGQNMVEPAAALVAMLESIALDVLKRLYPPTSAA